jgi:hypothetical protein
MPARRLKGARAREAFEIAQQFARLHAQCLGACGGNDSAPGLDEQGVAGNAAQFVEQVTDGRLRDPEPLGGGRYRATVENGHQHLQQSGVEFRPINFTHEFHYQSLVHL